MAIGFAVRLAIVPSWPEALDRAYVPDSIEWRAFEAALAGIKAASDRRGLPPPLFAVLNQGSSSERPTDYFPFLRLRETGVLDWRRARDGDRGLQLNPVGEWLFRQAFRHVPFLVSHGVVAVARAIP